MDANNPRADRSDLAGATLSAGAYTIVSQGLTTVINTLSLAILARIISPNDFGLVAKVAAIVGLTNLIGDFGITVPIVQNKTLNQKQLSGLFWVAAAVGGSLAVLVACTSPLLSRFYGDPRVITVTVMSAATMAIRTPSAHHMALLRRRLQFGWLALVQVTATVISVLVAILCARAGMGYWALLLQTLTFAVLSTSGSWLATGWSPSLYFSFREIKEKLKMGGNFTLGNILNYCARNGDNVLIARVWGEASVAFYAKAYGLLVLPLQQIARPMGQVAVPALSRLQNDPDRYRQFFRKGCLVAFVLQIPFTVFAAFAGREIVLAVLGPAWSSSIPIFWALVPNLFISTTSPATQWVFLSRGDTDRWLKLVAVNSALILVGFAIGVAYGPIGVAAALSIVTCAIRIPSISYCFGPAPLELSDFFPAMVTPTLCSVFAWAVGAAIILLVQVDVPWILLLLKAILFFSVYAVSILSTTAGRTCVDTVRPHLLESPIFRRYFNRI